MTTSFKMKAAEELRQSKRLEREAEAAAHAQSTAAKYAKNVANEKRIADKIARIEKGEEPVVVEEVVVEEPVAEVEEIVVEKPVKEPAPKKAKPTDKKRGRPAKAKK
tara:strand:+ start:3524 stop:3844 length:321 start_codon:yes stop_codon:yes gene_type:complete